MEEDFPRGGKKQTDNQSQFNRQSEEDLFIENEDVVQEDSKKGKKGKKNKQKKPAVQVENVPTVNLASSRPEPLKKKQIYEGMTVLGYVKSVESYSLAITLPNGLKGKVPITSISRAYTQQLQALAQAESQEEQEHVAEGVSSLPQLFKVGMIVPCKVLKKGKGISLSLDPKEVNSEVAAEKLRNNMVLYGSISSCEDHGYTVDLGIPGIHTFLPNKQADNYIKTVNHGSPLLVGQLCRCKIQMKNSKDGTEEAEVKRVINVTVDPSQMTKPEVTDKVDVGFNSLVAGMKVKARIEQVIHDGLHVTFGGLKGCLHTTAMTDTLKKYSPGNMIVCSILSIHPLTKAINLTLHPHLVTYSGVALELFPGHNVGDVFDQAVVTRSSSDDGVFFTLPQNVIGCATTDQLDCERDSIPKKFKKGSQYKCRIIAFAPMEGHIIVSCKQEILDRKYMRVTDVQPGDVVKVEIKEFKEKGVYVSISKGIYGFIPKIHMADVTLQHPEKKFEVGQAIKCKVTHLSKNSSVMLTHKKSLINSKFTVPTSYEELKPGMELEGFVNSIKEFGIFVHFLNHVEGLVPRTLLSVESIDVLEKVFYRGQVVRCRVVSVNPENKKLKLTCILEDKASFGQKIADAPEDFELGKIVSCKVVKKIKTGIDVMLTGSQKMAFLPKMHLSDSFELCNILWDIFQPDDVIDEVLYTSRQNNIVVSMKSSLMAASRSDDIITDFGELEVGLLLKGWIQSIASYGLFVETLGRFVGLIPKRFVCDKQIKDISGLYSVGQSVSARVLEIDVEKKRYLGSMRMADCYHGDTQASIDLLQNYLSQRVSIKEKLAGTNPLYNLEVGGIYKAVVKAEHEQGLLLQMASGVQAVAAFYHYEHVKVSVGQEVECAVLFVDILQTCVEVTLDTRLLKQLQTRQSKGKSMQKVQVDQRVKSMVQLVKNDFILVSLKNQGSGQLAYLPAKRDLNDVLEPHQFGIGQENKVVIKSIDDDMVIASLAMNEEKDKKLKKKEEKEEKEDENTHVPKHDLSVGDVSTAVVTKTWTDKMQIRIANITGLVHRSEVADTVSNGNNPLSRFQKGMEIKVRVIGFKCSEPKRVLPLTGTSRLRTGMPQCSLRRSVMKMKKIPEDYESYVNTFKEGDRAVGFAMKYSGNCWWLRMSKTVEGRLFTLNLSENIEDLQHPEKFCQINKGYTVKVLRKVNDTLLEVTLIDKKLGVKKQTTCMGIVKAAGADRGLSLQLPDGYRGSVDLTDLSDQFEEKLTNKYDLDQVIQCYVLDVDDKTKQASLSLRLSRLQKVKSGAIMDPEVNDYTDIHQGQVIKGYVTRVTGLGINVRLGREVNGLVACDRVYSSTSHVEEDNFPTGSVVTVNVLSVDKKTKQVSLSMLEEDTGVVLRRRKRRVSECSDDGSQKKQKSERKRTVSNSSDTSVTNIGKNRKRKTSESKSDQKTVIESNVQSKKKSKRSRQPSDSDSGVEVIGSQTQGKKPVLEVEGGFSWDTNFSLPVAAGEISSDDSDDDNEEKPTKKTKEEIFQQKKEEERKLFEYERQTLEGERLPETADDFDRLVLQSPNSSLIWLRYMAFHLETSDIDWARAVAERALKTISFVEEQEKLNVWVALLNLENMYGTSETLGKVLARALQQCDQIAVYTQMIDIYVKSDKIEEAEHQFSIMAKKYHTNKDVWIKFGQFYFQHQRLESARKLLQRCLKSLDDKFHVETIAKYAQMEFKYGEPERGKTMYDNILSSYPGRTDLWSVYLDMVTKLGDHTCTRNLFNKVVSKKMGAKKVKFFFKKFLQFEEKYGTKAQIDEVKKKALEYVESQGYVNE